MSSSVISYVQPITQPLERLHSSFTQLAAQHRDANAHLSSHANELLSGTTVPFKGQGATAFAGLVNYYMDTSNKHMQVFEDAARAVQSCHSDITNATGSAASAGLHEGLVNHVLTKVPHDHVIQQGSDAILVVVNDMMNAVHDMGHSAGNFFGDLVSGNISGAWSDAGHFLGDIGQTVGDVFGLLQDIGNVLGSWASTIRDAISKCLNFIGSAALQVLDFVTGFSSIINDIKTIANGKASIWDKLLAAGDLVLNVGMDISMLFGVGEALKGGELLLKGGVELVEKVGEEDGTKLIEKFAGSDGDKALELLGSGEWDAFFSEEMRLPYAPQEALVRQLQPGSCIAASSKMLLSHYGIDVPEAYLRDALKIDAVKGGFTKDVPEALKDFGLNVEHAYREDLSIDALEKALQKGPAIAAMPEHALVVDAIKDGKVFIRDPLGTAYAVAKGDFVNAWLRESGFGRAVIPLP